MKDIFKFFERFMSFLTIHINYAVILKKIEEPTARAN